MAARPPIAGAVRKAARRLTTKHRAPKGTGPTMIQRSRAVSPLLKATYNTEGRVPRDFFALSPADEAEIESTIEAFLDKALKE